MVAAGPCLLHLCLLCDMLVEAQGAGLSVDQRSDHNTIEHQRFCGCQPDDAYRHTLCRHIARKYIFLNELKSRKALWGSSWNVRDLKLLSGIEPAASFEVRDLLPQIQRLRAEMECTQPKSMVSFVQGFSALLRSCNPTISIMGSDGEDRKPTAS